LETFAGAAIGGPKFRWKSLSPDATKLAARGSFETLSPVIAAHASIVIHG